MSASPEQGIAKPGRVQVPEDADALDLTLGTGPSTTIGEVQREIALRPIKQELGIGQAEWLRLQQEILKFMRHENGEPRTNEDAAVAFLNDTGAKDRFFGLLAGGEAEGMLVNRAGLAWGIDDHQIIPQIAAIFAAWKPTSLSYDDRKVQVPAKRTTKDFENDEQITATKRRLNPKVLAMLPAEVLESCGITGAQSETNDSLFVKGDHEPERQFSPKVMAMLPADIFKSSVVAATESDGDNALFIGDDRASQRQRRDEIAIAPRKAAQRKTRRISTPVQAAAQYKKNDSLFVDDDQHIPTQRRNKNAGALPEAMQHNVPRGSTQVLAAAQYEAIDTLFVGNDQDRQHQRRSESAMISQEAMHPKTRRTCTQVQTASAPKADNKQRALPVFSRPTSFNLDVWPKEPEVLPIAVPAASKAWLKISLYVGGKKMVPGHKVLMLERITSLASFNSQVFNAYHGQVEGIHQNVPTSLIRFYEVHYGIGGRGSVVRIDANDDRSWRVALEKLQTVGEAGRTVLKGFVEVHLWMIS